MKNAIIIHGTCGEKEYFSDEYPSLSNSHWFPWLQKQLLIKNIFTQTPEMPEAYKPQYEKWKSEFERFEISEETVLIGHSCGGGFLTRWLSENEVKINKLILVAPWLDPRRRKTTDYFDFEIDKGLVERIGEIHIFVSTDDEEEIQESVRIIKDNLAGIIEHTFVDRGHFTYGDMGTDKFLEILEIID